MLSLPGLCRGCCKRSGRDLLKISHVKSIDLRAFFLLVYHFHLARNNTPQVPSELWSMSLDSAWPLFPGSLWWQSCGSSVQLQEREGSLADPPAPPPQSKEITLVTDSSTKDEQTPQTCWQAASIRKCDGFGELSGHRRNWREQA